VVEAGVFTDEDVHKGLRSFARVTQALLVLAALSSLIAAVFDWQLLRTITQLLHPGTRPDPSSARTVAHGAVVASYAQIGCLVLTGIAFISWLFVGMRTVRRRRPHAQRLTPRWAFWSWVTPVLSFYTPKEIVNDLWNAPADSVRRPGLLNAWWALWLMTYLLERVILGVGEGLSAARSTVTLAIASSAIQACDAILAVAVVGLLTHRVMNTAQSLDDVSSVAIPLLDGHTAASPPSPVVAALYQALADNETDQVDGKWQRFMHDADG
jgi:hypothetical protein